MALSAVDHEALERSLVLAMRGDPLRRQQLQRKLRDVERGEDTWQAVAMFASYCCQCGSLHLKPWEKPPCHLGDAEPRDDPNKHGLREAWALRQRLIGAGLSMYEPDPVAALAAVAATTAATPPA